MLKKIKLNKASYHILVAAIAIVVSLLVAPSFAASSNLCSPCHGSTYTQQLDLLEGNSQNIIPTTVQVGQTQTVTVILQNINDAPRYNQLSSVSVTLSSQNGHFSVSQPTVTISSLPTGTAKATWQITGVSQGSDVLLISASATNQHNNIKLSDNYLPSASITVTAAPTPTPTPTPTATPLPTSTPTPKPTITPTPTPAPTSTPKPTTTPTPPATTPTPTPSTNPTPTTTPSNTPTPTQPATQYPTPTPTTQPTQTPSTSPTPDSTPSTSPPNTNLPKTEPSPAESPLRGFFNLFYGVFQFLLRWFMPFWWFI